LSYTSCFLPNILDLANCIACYSLHHGFELQALSSKFRDFLQATSKLSSLADLDELTDWFFIMGCVQTISLVEQQ
jgi:hypothetical protein